jgi:putative serine protease PepD
MVSTPGRPGSAVPPPPQPPTAETTADAEISPRWSVRRRRIAVGSAVLVALVVTALLFYSLGSTRTPQALPTASPKPSPSPAPSISQIFATIAPSVVFIEAVHTGSNASESTGTGVIVNGDGTILTARHVINGAQAIKVTFADGTASAVTIVATDPVNDIAALLPATLPSVVVPAVLGRSDRLNVGDEVVAIGNPLGLTYSTTAGVVSGLGRRISVADGPTGANLIQFDAAVNPGSSGGPLINGRGETVGIVVALANPTSAGTFIGIGFAVPIATAVAGGGGRAPQQ